MKSLAIEREFGSGGREIGMRVAELAGIPYYDGELLIKAAEAQGVSIELHIDVCLRELLPEVGDDFVVNVQ